MSRSKWSQPSTLQGFVWLPWGEWNLELTGWVTHAGFAICLYSSDQCHISQWNYHGMRTVGHQTPMAMWNTGLLTAPQESVVTNWQTHGIFTYWDFHSTKQALWLVDSWSHTPNQIQMYPYRETINSCYLFAEYNSTFVCFCHMIA